MVNNLVSKIETVINNPGVVIWRMQEWFDRKTLHNLHLNSKDFLEKV
jgi:hypothetical protein